MKIPLTSSTMPQQSIIVRAKNLLPFSIFVTVTSFVDTNEQIKTDTILRDPWSHKSS